MRNIKRVINLSVRFHVLDKSNTFTLDGTILKAVNNTPKKHKEMCGYLKKINQAPSGAQ